MNLQEVRKRFLDFFEKRGHAVLPSASLVPQNDPSVLFTTAGVQPLVPYILQGSHPEGTRLVSVQKCLRTTDIDDVGDNTHATFFEMLGNWSIGDYFKKDAIKWSYELLTSKEEGFGLDPNRLYVTVYEGSDGVPRDEESVEYWKQVGVPEHRIYFLGDDNFWPKPKKNDDYSGPCGPSTEMFYDLTENGLGDLTPEEFLAADEKQDVVEIWNDVFMEYKKESGVIVGKLEKQNVDTGSGLERLLVILQNKNNIFETDAYAELMDSVRKEAKVANEKAIRIIVDHLKSAIFLVAEGIEPSNTGRGYVVRRLLRRVLRNKQKLDMLNTTHGKVFLDIITEQYGNTYPELKTNKEFILEHLADERKLFEKPLSKLEEFKGDLKAIQEGLPGTKRIKDTPIINEKGKVSGAYVYQNYQSYGIPYDLSIDIIHELGLEFDQEEFDAAFKAHQELSRTSSAGKFKGGLAGGGEMETKYHTATHLLNAALREVLGDHVEQKGSNITVERLRFDFSHPEKLTSEQKEAITDLVNKWIEEDYTVSYEEMSPEEAKQQGAIGVFGDKYGEKVKVYSVGTVSKEICGGPHVENTGTLGTFKIKKEEASSAGVRRIKAILE